jgi:hypothetical protein
MSYATHKTPVRAGVELFVLFSLFGFIGGGIVSSVGCKGLTPEAKQNIVNGEKVACGLANAFMSDPEITALCNFANQETAPILNLVALHRAALAKSRAIGVTEGATKAGCAPSSLLKDANVGANAGPVPDGGTRPVTDGGVQPVTDGGSRPVAPKAR